jgi:uncharacterized repeat protein (TIGR02543 family)
MAKRNISFFVCLNVAFMVFWACDSMATLFHGSEPEEEEKVPMLTVIFDANGATGMVPPAQTVNSGTVITMPSGGGLVKGNSVFTGWNVSSSGGGTTYPSESSYTVTADQAFYAQWTDPVEVYTIIFDANGATGTVPPAQTVNSGTVITMPGEGGLTNGVNVFTGWNVSSSGGGTTYPPESPYTVTADQTFYAQWTDPAQVYTVTYDANGASGAPPSPRKVAQNGSTVVAGKGSLTKANKDFTGWNTQADGLGTGYNTGATLIVSANITLYAQWVDSSIPTELSVTGQTTNSITLSWQQVTGATGYKVYKGSSSDAVNEYVAAASSASYTVTGLEANTRYYFAVRTVNASGESLSSAPVQGTTLAATLQMPGNLRISSQTSNSLTLSWEQAPGAAGYRITRSIGSANSYSPLTTTTNTTYPDTGLMAATTYYYRVTAYNGQNESDAATTSGTTSGDDGTLPLPPAKPTGLVVSSSSSGSVSLSWNTIANAYSYDVYRANTKTSALARIGTNITGTSWTDSTVSAGVMYYYTVRGVNTSGSSPDSNMAFACAASHYALPSYSSPQTINLYPNTKHYYRLAVSAGQWITITWQNGSNANVNSDIRVSAWQNDGTAIFTGEWSGYTSPKAFAVTGAGYVTVEVNNSSGSTGYNYQIYYSF